MAVLVLAMLLSAPVTSDFPGAPPEHGRRPTRRGRGGADALGQARSVGQIYEGSP